MFGGAAKAQASCLNPIAFEGELDRVTELRIKTGPHADHQRLLYHVRGARGKLHWAGQISLVGHGCMHAANPAALDCFHHMISSYIR